MKKCTFNVTFRNGIPVRVGINTKELAKFLNYSEKYMIPLTSRLCDDVPTDIRGYMVTKHTELYFGDNSDITKEFAGWFAEEWERVCIPLRRLRNETKMRH